MIRKETLEKISAHGLVTHGVDVSVEKPRMIASLHVTAAACPQHPVANNHHEGVCMHRPTHLSYTVATHGFLHRENMRNVDANIAVGESGNHWLWVLVTPPHAYLVSSQEMTLSGPTLLNRNVRRISQFERSIFVRSPLIAFAQPVSRSCTPSPHLRFRLIPLLRANHPSLESSTHAPFPTIIALPHMGEI